jgi:hypothetical protein
VVYISNSTSLLPSATSFLYAMTRMVVAAPGSRRMRNATQGVVPACVRPPEGGSGTYPRTQLFRRSSEAKISQVRRSTGV